MYVNDDKVIIFDFDGTIADTFSIVVEIVNSMSDEYGFKKLGIEEVSALRHHRAQDVLKIFSISLWKIPKLLFAVKERLGTEIHTVKPFLGMIEVLDELHRAGYRLGVLSSNRKETVDAFLKQNNVTVFDFVYCEKDLFGKARVLSKLIDQYKFKKAQVVYVGDETRDVEAAQAAKVQVVAVSWGYNTASSLEKQHPCEIVYKPHELVSVIEHLF